MKGGNLVWSDASDASRSYSVPLASLTEQFQSCLKKSGICFEWGFRTKDGREERFRDALWEQGETRKVLDVYQLLGAALPGVPAPRLSVEGM